MCVSSARRGGPTSSGQSQSRQAIQLQHILQKQQLKFPLSFRVQELPRHFSLSLLQNPRQLSSPRNMVGESQGMEFALTNDHNIIFHKTAGGGGVFGGAGSRGVGSGMFPRGKAYLLKECFSLLVLSCLFP